jgi:hypothetical protein
VFFLSINPAETWEFPRLSFGRYNKEKEKEGGSAD